MKINEKMINPGPDVFYQKEFYDVLESHMNFLRAHPDNVVVQVDSHRADVFDGDLYGFLQSAQIASKLHWTIMRMNNMFSPYDFGPGVQTLIIPDERAIESLRQTHKSTNTGAIEL